AWRRSPGRGSTKRRCWRSRRRRSTSCTLGRRRSRLARGGHADRALLLELVAARDGIGIASPTQQEADMKTIVLVHGAWADGSSWDKVAPLLIDKGHKVVAVYLPLSSLADDVAAVRRVIRAQTEPMLLVGHSYGGVVITEA